VEYGFHLLNIAGIYTILALSLNLSVGYCGLPVLGQVAFACVGAYTSSLLCLDLGWSPWLGFAAAGLVAAGTGVLLFVSCLRLRGDYLALATFGFGVIVYAVAKNWAQLTRGPLGLSQIPPFSVMGVDLSRSWAFFPLVAVCASVTYWIEHRIVSSPFGRVLQCIRDDETATRACGKRTIWFKLQTLVLTAFFAGLAGSLYAHYVTFIDPSSFTVNESVAVLLMVVFGGMASLRGSVFGPAVLVLLPEALRFFVGIPQSIAAPMRQMIYGLLLVVILLKRPQGLLGASNLR
jgi:branched-chain amino acid transport system permease protein